MFAKRKTLGTVTMKLHRPMHSALIHMCATFKAVDCYISSFGICVKKR